MGRKKSYKKEGPKPPNAPAPAASAAADDEDADPAPETGAGDAAPAIVPEVIAVEGGAGEAQTVPGRPEWAMHAPGRLEAAEEESFWYAFALAVMACSPPVMAIPAALLAAGLGARIVRALYSAPTEVAPGDLGNARMLCFGSAFIAAMHKAGGGGMTGMAWVMITVFFFNALRNARIMVGIAARGGPKKRKRQEREAAQQQQAIPAQTEGEKDDE